MIARIGVDTGGTYTDIVSADGTVLKILSRPDDPAAAVLAGVAQAGPADVVAHGTTVATNALLERRGGRVVLYSTLGHADVIEIARQTRPSLYDPFVDRPEPLVPRDLRLEVPGRLDGKGREIEPVGLVPLPRPIEGAGAGPASGVGAGSVASPGSDAGASGGGSVAVADGGDSGTGAGGGDSGAGPGSVAVAGGGDSGARPGSVAVAGGGDSGARPGSVAVAGGGGPDSGAGAGGGDPAPVDAAAVVLLHADRNASHETLVATQLRAAGLDVTTSSEISPEFREYERTVTTVANAYLRRPCRQYLLRLADAADQVLVMTSAGGLIPLDQAAERPVTLLLSGPAGGVLAASSAAVAAGFPDALTLDMGGTSTDVCLILGGRAEPAAQREIAGFPIRVPSLDVHTIGAGGGSVAYLDTGGALVVGPESAGAMPGPACYGRGGVRPTVTDANVVAGRIPEDLEFPGLGRLDGPAARRALETAGVTAEGVLAVVDANMVRALRRVSVERGIDPRGLALVAFGGAGPLHACGLADALAMPAVVVPARAGVLSAAGMLGAPRQVDLVRSWPRPEDHSGAATALAELAADAVAQLGAPATEVEVETLFDCRYLGQSHELVVATIAGFGREHERRNGFSRPDALVEVVALRASARWPSPVQWADLPDPDGRSGVVVGPAVIAEADCTVWVAEGWTASVGGGNAWVLTR